MTDLKRIADALERIANAITDDDGNSLLEELVHKLEGLRIQASQISEGVCGPWPSVLAQELASAGVGVSELPLPELSDEDITAYRKSAKEWSERVLKNSTVPTEVVSPPEKPKPKDDDTGLPDDFREVR